MEYRIKVDTFDMGELKERALKPLEEAAEVFGAWQLYKEWSDVSQVDSDDETRKLNVAYALNMANLADEIADCIQACCNLANTYGIDLQEAMDRCNYRNWKRGRYD